MHDETQRLKSKLERLEAVLEKQRWTQKDQIIKFEKTVDKLEQTLADHKFEADYNKEQVLRYQLILNNLPEGIYIMDATGSIIAVNQLAKELIEEDDIIPILLEACSGESIHKRLPVDETSESSSDLIITANPLRDDESKIVGSVAVIRQVDALSISSSYSSVSGA